MYIHTCAHTHIYTRAHTGVYTLYTNIHVYVHAHAHLYACTRVRVCKFIHMCLSGPGSHPQSVIWKSKPAAGCGSFHAAKFGPWRSVIKADQGRRLAADSRARILQGDSYARTRRQDLTGRLIRTHSRKNQVVCDHEVTSAAASADVAAARCTYVARTLHVRCT